ncbi:hypothetical protein T05_2333, partial [Trichinella murrelli]
LLVVGLRLLHYFPLHAEHVPCSPSLVHMKSRNHAGRRVVLLFRPTSHASAICCRSWYGFRRSKWTTTGSFPPRILR